MSIYVSSFLNELFMLAGFLNTVQHQGKNRNTHALSPPKEKGKKGEETPKTKHNTLPGYV